MMKKTIMLFAALVIFLTFGNVEATHVSCDDTLTTSTILDSNLTCTGNGLTIGASNLILNCNNFTLQGSLGGIGIIIVNHQNVTVKNCEVKGFGTGLYLSSSNNNTLISNTANGNINGEGIFISSSLFNNISGNTANSNYRGIWLDYSNNNTLISNTANGNTDSGIFFRSSTSNNLIDNTANANFFGYNLWLGSMSNTFINNTANSNSWIGIDLDYLSVYNTLLNNTANSNYWAGISFGDFSNSNTAFNNVITANSMFGIVLGSITSDNLIYNNFLNNSVNARDLSANFWNITKDCSQNNIIGGPCIGGNFWSDYNGVDEDGDGIGDTNTPYNSNGNIVVYGDFLPLTNPNYKPSITSPPITKAAVNQVYYYDVNAIDPDNDALTYSLLQKPQNMTIDPLTGLIEWLANVTLPKTQSGNKAGIGAAKVNVSVQVADVYGASATQNFTIIVGIGVKK